MIKTRVRKILRDVWARKGRTLLVSIAIFVGVTGTIALFSMSDILVSQLREDIKEDELAMVQIAVVAEEGTQPDDVSLLNQLSSYPGVTQVQAGFEELPIYFKTNLDDEEFETGTSQAYVALDETGSVLVDVPMDAPPPLEPFRLLDGGAWPVAGQHETLIEQRMADEYGLDVGDTIYLRILSPSRDSEKNGEVGTVEAWTISGLVFDPYALTPTTSIYPRFADGQYIVGLETINDLWLRFTSFAVAEESESGVSDFIANQTVYAVRFSQAEDPAQNQLITSAEIYTQLMGMLALIALLVSGFLVVNVITSLVVEQKKQIGVMKSMGATRRDNFFIYSGIAFTYGLIGVIPGVILGIPLGNMASNWLAPQLNVLLEGFNVSMGSVILGIAVGLLIPILASVIPVYNGTRVQILEAMTDLGIDANYGTGPIARLIGILPLPVTVRQGLSNVSLKKSRLAFTVLTLAIAVGAFMGIFALFESFTNGLNIFFDSWNMHVGIFPTDFREPEQIYAVVDEGFADRVKGVQPGAFLQIEFEGYTPEATAGGPPGIFAYGYDVTSDNPAFLFELSEGETLTPDTAENGIILSSLLAANMDKKVSDVVVMKVPGSAHEFTVVGIADFPIEQAWASWQVLSLLQESTIVTIDSDTPVPADMIPISARSFIKYATVAQVEGYEPATSVMPGVMILGFTPSVTQFLQFEDGGFVTPGEPGIMISADMAANGGYQVGDMLTLNSATPKGSQNAEFPIVGIFDPPMMLAGGESDAEASAGTIDLLAMYWRDAAEFDAATIDVAPLPGGYFVTLPDDKPSAKEAGDLLNDLNDAFLDQGITIVGFNFVELTEEISNTFRDIQLILSSVAGLIALVGALGLLTTLSMSVFERQKEIGVMRSIGAGSSTIALQFLTEGLVVGFISWLVGIPLMVGIQMLLLGVTGFSETFPFEFSVTAVVVGLVAMLVIATIASLWPSLGAARKTVSDILRYQ